MHFDGGDEVNIVPFVYPRGTASVSSLGSFSSVGSSSKPYHPYLPLSLGAHSIQEYFKKKKKKERKRKFIKPQQEKARQEEQTKRDNVVVQAKLVVGYWDLIPMESCDEFSDPHDTSTVRVSEEIWAGKKKRNQLWSQANWPRLKEALVKSRYQSLRGQCDVDCLELGLD